MMIICFHLIDQSNHKLSNLTNQRHMLEKNERIMFHENKLVFF